MHRTFLARAFLARTGVGLGLGLGLPILAVLLAGRGDRVAAESAAEVLEIHRGALSRPVLLTGELAARDATALSTPNANIWPMTVRWLAEDGAEVGQGEPVVEFDNSQLTVNLEDLRGRVIEAENELTSRRARLAGEISSAGFTVEERRAEAEKARLDAEVPFGIHAQREYERKQLELRRAELQLEEAERQLHTTREAGEADVEIQKVALEQVRRELERAEVGIELLSLRAPRAGIFLSGVNPMEDRPFQAGDASWPGITVGSLPELETMVVHARLFDVDDGRVVPGQVAEATLDAFPDRTFRGRVRDIDGVAQEAARDSPRRFFRVVVELDELDLEIMRPGMSVKVVIAAEPRPEALLAPRAAIDFAAPRVRLGGGGWAAVVLGACGAMACEVEDGPPEGTRLLPVRAQLAGSEDEG